MAAVALGPFLGLAGRDLPPGDAARYRALDRALAVARVEVLVVDDAHLLDDASFGFLSHATASCRPLVLAARPRTAGAARLTTLARTAGLERIDLTALDVEATARLTSLVAGVALSSREHERVWRRTLGNPLLVCEVARGETLDRLHDTFGGLVAGIDPDDPTLALLAVIEPLGLDLLARFASAAVLETLEQRGLVECRRSGHRVEVSLAHPMFAELVRERIGHVALERHRRLLLDELGRTPARRGDDKARARLLRCEAGRADVADLLAAARDARLAPDASAEETARAAALARRAVESGGGFEAAELLFELAAHLGDIPTATYAFDRMEATATGEVELVRLARLGGALAFFSRGDAAEAVAVLDRARSRAVLPESQAALAATEAHIVVFDGRVADGEPLARAVLDDPAGSRRDRLAATGDLATCLAQGGRSSLAGRGLADREIATELVLSVRTVQSHLQNAYRKLGVRQRTELPAALAGIDASKRQAPGPFRPPVETWLTQSPWFLKTPKLRHPSRLH